MIASNPPEHEHRARVKQDLGRNFGQQGTSRLPEFSFTNFPSFSTFDRIARGKRIVGFSLVEVMISMFVLTLMIAAFSKGLLYAKATAEDNLYTSTALTVGISTMEQMKGASINQISSPAKVGGKEVFTMIVEGGKDRVLILGEENIVTVPLVTDSSGVVGKTFDITITPSIEPMTGIGYWLSVRYSYEHPKTGRVRSETIRNARSTVRSL